MDADAAASGGSEVEEEIDDGASVVTTATGATTATASGEKDGKEKGGWLSKINSTLSAASAALLTHWFPNRRAAYGSQ